MSYQGIIEDKIEHYLVCPKAWSVLQQRPPYGLGLNRSRRTIEAMLLAETGLTDEERMAIAIGCYAVSRTVQCLRHRPASLRAAPIMRLYVSDGLRGSKARGRILKKSREIKNATFLLFHIYFFRTVVLLNLLLSIENPVAKRLKTFTFLN